jgi:hypothetical protein
MSGRRSARKIIVVTNHSKLSRRGDQDCFGAALRQYSKNLRTSWKRL